MSTCIRCDLLYFPGWLQNTVNIFDFRMSVIFSGRWYSFIAATGFEERNGRNWRKTSSEPFFFPLRLHSLALLVRQTFSFYLPIRPSPNTNHSFDFITAEPFYKGRLFAAKEPLIERVKASALLKGISTHDLSLPSPLPHTLWQHSSGTHSVAFKMWGQTWSGSRRCMGQCVLQSGAGMFVNWSPPSYLISSFNSCTNQFWVYC